MKILIQIRSHLHTVKKAYSSAKKQEGIQFDQEAGHDWRFQRGKQAN